MKFPFHTSRGSAFSDPDYHKNDDDEKEEKSIEVRAHRIE